MMSQDKLRIVVSHAEDQSYLYHCLDCLESVGFDRSLVWVDGFRSKCNEDIKDSVYKTTTHADHHGGRCFDVLSQDDKEFVVIMDSDFFCRDVSFWEDAFNGIEGRTVASISMRWDIGIPMLTTPFVLYNRRKVLDMVPVRSVWNHFSVAIPGLTNPVFDHLSFMFFTAVHMNQAYVIDYWETYRRKYKFSHFWDSRRTPQENFSAFDSGVRDGYLPTGVSKYIFHYVIGKVEKFDDRVWEYAKISKEISSYGRLLDVLENLEYQIEFKPEWVERFRWVKESFPM